MSKNKKNAMKRKVAAANQKKTATNQPPTPAESSRPSRPSVTAIPSTAPVTASAIPRSVVGGKPRAHIMVGTPAYGGLAYVSYVMSFLATQSFLKDHDVEITPCFLTNESLIPRGRNTCVAKFLNNPSFTHLLFIDADVNWAAPSVLKLLEHDRDIIGALYPKKGYEWNKLLKNPQIMQMLMQAQQQNRDLTEMEMAHIRAKLMSFVVNFDKSKPQIINSVASVRHIGTGFMMIKRSVFEKMGDAFPELKYDDDIGALQGTENNHLYAFFDCEIHKLSEKRHYLSEDYLFCKRWTDLGGEIYADLAVSLTHTGTHSFAGNFAISNNMMVAPQAPPAVAMAPPAVAKTATPPVAMPTPTEKNVEKAPKMIITPKPVQGSEPKPIRDISEATVVAPMIEAVETAEAAKVAETTKVAEAPAQRVKVSPADVGKIQIR